jgi:hypothetical protein
MQSAELGGNKAANVFSFDDPGARILLARTRCEQHVPNWPFRLLDQGGESLRPANAGMMPPRRITMPREASAVDAHSMVKEQVVELCEDFEHEVEREAHSPHDSSQSDLLVRKHINGVAITFFILIAVSLLAAILGYAIYTHY